MNCVVHESVLFSRYVIILDKVTRKMFNQIIKISTTALPFTVPVSHS